MSWHWRIMQIWKANDMSFENRHKEFEEFWLEHLKIYKICSLIGSFDQSITFQLKKYRGIIFDGTEDWCKSWGKTHLCFQKWHEEFDKFA